VPDLHRHLGARRRYGINEPVHFANDDAAAQQIVALALPTRSKQTQMITGSAPEAAKDLVRRLREEARAL